MIFLFNSLLLSNDELERKIFELNIQKIFITKANICRFLHNLGLIDLNILRYFDYSFMPSNGVIYIYMYEEKN